MAVVLLQLKLAIQRRALGRAGMGQRALFVLGWLLAAVLGIAAGAVVALLDSSRDGLGDLALVGLLTVAFVVWVLGPVLLPGIVDETVDPARLEQFPVRPRDQVAGLLLGALVSPTALFTFLLASGGTFAAGESAGARVAVVGAAAVFTVLCVASSRSVQAVLAGALTSRRGRDFAIAAGAVLALGAFLVSRSAHNLTDTVIGLEDSGVEVALSWLPPGAAGQAMIAVRDGDWGVALAHLLVALAGILLAAAAWGWGIRRRVRGTSGSTRRRRAAGPAARTALIPPPLNAVPPGPTAAAAAQQLRYYFFRSPRAVQAAALPPILAVVLGHTAAGEAGLVGGAAMVAFMAILGPALNVFGHDHPGFTYLLGSGAPMRQVIRGKALAGVVLVIPVMGVFVMVEAALLGAWPDVLPALLVGSAVALAGVGVGALTSVVAPTNQAHPGAGGRGRALISLLAAILALGLLGVGGTAAWLFTDGSVPPVVGAALALALAAALGWGLLQWAGARLARDPWRVQRLLRA